MYMFAYERLRRSNAAVLTNIPRITVWTSLWSLSVFSERPGTALDPGHSQTPECHFVLQGSVPAATSKGVHKLARVLADLEVTVSRMGNSGLTGRIGEMMRSIRALFAADVDTSSSF